MAGERVLGVGIGLFLLAFIWSLSLFVCILFSRAQGAISNAGIGALAFAGLFTLIVLVLPQEDPLDAATKIYDYSIIYRSCLIAGLALFLLIGMILYVTMHAMEPIYAKPLRKIRT